MSTRSVSVPTGTDDARLVARTVRLVLSIPAYAVLALAGSLVGLSVFVLTQNLPLVSRVIVGGSLPLDARLTILVNLYPYVGSAFKPMTEALLVSSASLFGVNAALLGYHLRQEQVSVRSGGGSVTGMLFGTLGAGCTACGSAIVAGLLSMFGATGVLAALPLEGMEFTILSILALLLSIYWLADGMRGAEVDGCPIDLAD